MANNLGRNGRRRRVLNEEALSASTAHLALRRPDETAASDGKTPRYGEQAAVHQLQLTDLLPRRWSMLGLVAGIGVATTALVEALHWYVDPVTTGYAGGALGPLATRVASGVDAWLNALLLSIAAATCLVIYSVRRHRIDDIRGRYRVWLAASAACTALSLVTVAPLHELFAAVATTFTGWTALPAHAAWWLVCGGLPLGWVTARTWLDARESRLAAMLLTASIAAHAIRVAAFLGGWPTGDSRIELLAASTTTTAGNWLLLLGVLAYGRFVMLDVEGLMAARRTGLSKQKAKLNKAATESTDVSPRMHGDRDSTANNKQTDEGSPRTLRAFREESQSAAKRNERVSESSRWVDGSEPVDEDYSDDDYGRQDRKLSKAERKRLRKLKAQNRAA